MAFRDVFKAGCSLYGVASLEALAKDTHKFESQYLDSLVGVLPGAKDIYEARSPIYHVDNFAAPICLIQGVDDKVVPMNQAEMMYKAAKHRGLPTALVIFEGEGHGFRKKENIRRALEAELYFFGKVLGFVPAGNDDIVPIHISNL